MLSNESSTGHALTMNLSNSIPLTITPAARITPRPRAETFTSISKRGKPLTIAMVWSDEWNNALQHPELMRQLEFRCLREHDPKPPDSADDGTIGRSLIVNHQNHRPVRRKMAFISSADHERGPRAHIG